MNTVDENAELKNEYRITIVPFIGIKFSYTGNYGEACNRLGFLVECVENTMAVKCDSAWHDAPLSHFNEVPARGTLWEDGGRLADKLADKIRQATQLPYSVKVEVRRGEEFYAFASGPGSEYSVDISQFVKPD